LSEQQAHIVIDVSNFVSWLSLLKVTQVFGELQPLDILEIRGADDDTKKDLFRILPKSAYHVLQIDYKDDDGLHQFQIQKQV
jgi:hypothetical protein